MIRKTTACLVVLGLIAVSPALLHADTIQTVSGETITGRETTVVDGLFVIPGEKDKPEQRLKLADLEKITLRVTWCP